MHCFCSCCRTGQFSDVPAESPHQRLQRVQLGALNVRVQLLDEEREQKLERNRTVHQRPLRRSRQQKPTRRFTSANFGVPARTALRAWTSSSLVMPWGSLGGWRGAGKERRQKEKNGHRTGPKELGDLQNHVRAADSASYCADADTPADPRWLISKQADLLLKKAKKKSSFCVFEWKCNPTHTQKLTKKEKRWHHSGANHFKNRNGVKMSWKVKINQ